jgi:hypothetical protein
MNSHKVVRLVSVLGLLLLSPPAWAWFAEGHEIVAIIATDDLTPTAKSHVAQILGVPAGSDSVEKAMAAASIRPDTEFRERDRATGTVALHRYLPSGQPSEYAGTMPTRELRHGKNR